jgi:hypothetical protein
MENQENDLHLRPGFTQSHEKDAKFSAIFQKNVVQHSSQSINKAEKGNGQVPER